MGKYYLAIDIGASSGRHILGHLEDGKMRIEEIHRFENEMVMNEGGLCWNLDKLFDEIIHGMKKCKELGRIPASVGIDTWAVDFVLLDPNDKVLGDTASYRNKRTNGMDEKVYSLIPEPELYGRTGIQKQIFNTIYQLMAIKTKQPEYLEAADAMLMIPDYFHYRLSGVKSTDYTNATTTQLVSPDTKEWDTKLIDLLGYPQKIFQPIVTPGTILGSLAKEVQELVGYNCAVVAPATHDTASAVLAVPSLQQHPLYISSGTWSLMGTERPQADCTKKSKEHNLTNEGGYDYRFRYLKNIMGLWMIQSVKRELELPYSYGELCELASKETIYSLVDCNHNRFLAPDSMIGEVKGYCCETGQRVPETVAELAAVIYNSLAMCYRNTICEIEGLTGCSYDFVHIVGGGANAEYLNQLTANDTERTVTAGPTEATAIGNLMVQMIAGAELVNLTEARKCVLQSFEIKRYESQGERI